MCDLLAKLALEFQLAAISGMFSKIVLSLLFPSNHRTETPIILTNPTISLMPMQDIQRSQICDLALVILLDHANNTRTQTNTYSQPPHIQSHIHITNKHS